MLMSFAEQPLLLCSWFVKCVGNSHVMDFLLSPRFLLTDFKKAKQKKNYKMHSFLEWVRNVPLVCCIRNI